MSINSESSSNENVKPPFSALALDRKLNEKSFKRLKPIHNIF